MARRPSQAFYAQIVGQVIRAHRHQAEVTLAVFAARIGSSPSGWSRVETGATCLTVVQLRRAARVLGTNSGAILRDADRIATELEGCGVVVSDTKPVEAGLSLSHQAIIAMVALKAQ